MDGCSLNLTISALACAIAKDKTPSQLTLLSVAFTQIGDALATIAAGNELCGNSNNSDTDTIIT